MDIVVDLTRTYMNPVANSKTEALALSIPDSEDHVSVGYERLGRVKDSSTVFFTLKGQRYFIGHGGSECMEVATVSQDGVSTERSGTYIQRDLIVGRAPNFLHVDHLQRFRERTGLPDEHYVGPDDKEGAQDDLPPELYGFLKRRFPIAELPAEINEAYIFRGDDVNWFLNEDPTEFVDRTGIYRGLKTLVIIPEDVDASSRAMKRDRNRIVNNMAANGDVKKWYGNVFYSAPVTPRVQHTEDDGSTYWSPTISVVSYNMPSGSLALKPMNPNSDNENEQIRHIEIRVAHAHPSNRRVLRTHEHEIGEKHRKGREIRWVDVPAEDLLRLVEVVV